MNADKIDRKALVTRHNPRYIKPQINAPLSVGNGRFCYTADFTGLQTFISGHSYFPLCTMSDWGWHSFPDTAGINAGAINLRANVYPPNFRLTPYDTWGREVGYAVDSAGQEELYNALRQNPHRFNLGALGFDLADSDISNCADIDQCLNLWDGSLDSSFTFRGERVYVQTCVHPEEDTVCVRVKSPLLKNGKLRVKLEFPYGSHLKTGGDFSVPSRHSSMPEKKSSSQINIYRRMDETRYTVQVLIGENSDIEINGAHRFIFSGNTDCLTAVFRYVRENGSLVSGIQADKFFDEGKKAAAAFWEKYWTEGGAVDFGESAAADAGELERRIVLSQYLTAIQSRGSMPPAETGLTCNSWYGKFHLEMHYWHCAHFPLWNRTGELVKSLSWYKTILGQARKIAASQGYTGARWPKMCGPSGDNSPSPIAVLLVWQQPHPILLAELCYHQYQSRAFLSEYRDIVVESAEFMLSFIHPESGRYVLGPPLIPAQERFDPRTVLNPGYETEYFRWGLRQANIWLNRLGERMRPDFEEAAARLAVPAVYEGVFPAHENCPDTFTRRPFNTDHPSMLGMLGLLDGHGIDKKIMNDTLDRVLRDWDLDSCWGWDFPMMAMTALRLDRVNDAVRFLLMDSPKNTYLANGHNAQGDRDDLPLYLPGNGGLLLAAAMMAAGWGNDPGALCSGKGECGIHSFGSYKIKYENLMKYI